MHNTIRTRRVKNKIISTINKVLRCMLIFLQHFYGEIHGLEQIFIKMQHIYSFVCQLFFFTMVEMAFPDPEFKKDERVVSGLTTLLFYSVIGYFVTRIKDIYIKSWSRNATNDNNVRNCMYWLCKVAVEWLKAIVIIICLREQGMKYHPRVITTFLTFGYYLCSEKVFNEIIYGFISYLELEVFESLEHLIVPILFSFYLLLMSVFVMIKLLFTNDAKYALIASYFLLYLRLKDVIYNYIKVLIVERETYASFRQATEKDIAEWDDICAVCLNRMSRARITPCNHLFHPSCLKQCLKSSYQCPLCKRDFIR